MDAFVHESDSHLAVFFLIFKDLPCLGTYVFLINE